MKTSHQSDDDDHDEDRVLEALRRHLRSPERVALAVEAYRKEREGLARVHARDRRAIEREPAEWPHTCLRLPGSVGLPMS